jgi:uncharacterized protein (TIGR00299 family) protein
LNETIAYLDCFSGLSGDMFLGALLDAGLPIKDLEKQLQTLSLEGYRLEVTRKQRNRISGTRIRVRLDRDKQIHRNLEAIREIIRRGDLRERVKERSIQVFQDLAQAEGRIHDLPPENIHFHEVGAVDSIVDIVGTIWGLDRMGIGALFVSYLPLGSGFVESAHGRIPIPAPATISLLKNVPVYDSGISQEMVTPTGAALVKNLASSFGPMPPMRPKQIGYGVGKRDLPDRPNLLRIVIGEQGLEKEGQTVVVLETNIDDANPELLGFLMDRLFEAGALDVIFCPVQMKKNRPGVQVQVIGGPDDADMLVEILFRESTTLGVRVQWSERRVLKRSMVEVESPWGPMRVKKVTGTTGAALYQPEYEACREIALKHNQPLRSILNWVMGLNKAR